MVKDLKPYRYTAKEDTALDAAFAKAERYENVKLDGEYLFWKPMFRWHRIPISQAQRIFRRVQDVRGRLCCGGRNFRIEWLVLLLKDGSELQIHVGDAVGPTAQARLEALQVQHPELQYGKP